MRLLELLVNCPMAECVGWALLHFLWQGALLGAVLKVVLLLLKRKSASARYSAACCALLIMSLCPILTAVSLQRSTPTVAHRQLDPGAPAKARPSVSSPLTVLAVASAAAAPAASNFETRAMANPIRSLPFWMFELWMGGVLLLSARLFGAWLLVQRLIRRSALRMNGPLTASLAKLAARMRIRRLPRLRASFEVRVPTMVGGLCSVILLPASTASGLSTEMLQSLLAHELAHLKRHDYLVNLWQYAVETILFYHPAVWWVSKTIRLERELCCDDMVVSVLDDRAAHARALATLEDMRWRPLALAASDGELLTRIRRIVSGGTTMHAGRHSALSSLALAAFPAILVAVSFGFVPLPARYSQSGERRSAGQNTSTLQSSVDHALTGFAALEIQRTFISPRWTIAGAGL